MGRQMSSEQLHFGPVRQLFLRQLSSGGSGGLGFSLLLSRAMTLLSSILY